MPGGITSIESVTSRRKPGGSPRSHHTLSSVLADPDRMPMGVHLKTVPPLIKPLSVHFASRCVEAGGKCTWNYMTPVVAGSNPAPSRDLSHG